MVSKKYYLINRDYYLRYQEDLYNNNNKEFRIRYNKLSPEEKEKKIDYSKNYYLNLAEDKKNQIKEKIKNRCHNMTDEKLQKYQEYEKNYQKIEEKKKQELKNSKKKQDNIDKNAVLTPPKP